MSVIEHITIVLTTLAVVGLFAWVSHWLTRVYLESRNVQARIAFMAALCSLGAEPMVTLRDFEVWLNRLTIDGRLIEYELKEEPGELYITLTLPWWLRYDRESYSILLGSMQQQTVVGIEVLVRLLPKELP